MSYFTQYLNFRSLWDWSLNIGFATRLAFCSVFALASLLIYSGILYKVTLKTGKTSFKKIIIAYKFGFGDNRVAHMDLNELKHVMPGLPRVVISYNGYIYKKDPRKLESYAIGIIVSVDDRPVWLNHVNTLRAYNYGFAELPGTSHAILAKFPHQNYLSLCLASFKVLPKIAAYVKRERMCAHPVIQIIKEEKIEYVVPLAWQFDFYVAEAKKYYRMLDVDYHVVIRATPEPTRTTRRKRKKHIISNTSDEANSSSGSEYTTASDGDWLHS